MLAGVLEARHLHIIEDLIAVAVGAQGIGAQDERLRAVAEAVAVGVGAGGVGADEALLRVAQAIGVGIHRVGGLSNGRRRTKDERRIMLCVRNCTFCIVLSWVLMRVPIRGRHVCHRLATGGLFFSFALLLRAGGIHLVREGVGLLALQQRRDDHRGQHGKDEGGVEFFRAITGHEQGQKSQADREHQRRGRLLAGRRARPAREMAAHRGYGGFFCREAGKIGLDLGLDALALLVGRVDQVDAQPDGQAALIQPDLALARGLHVATRRVQRHIQRQFAGGA